MTFATLSPVGYTTAHSSAKGVLCRHESKTCLGSRFSHQSQQPLPGGQPGSNIIGATIRLAVFNFAMCLSVANLGSGRKLENGLLHFNHRY